jgi:hypothetical protein
MQPALIPGAQAAYLKIAKYQIFDQRVENFWAPLGNLEGLFNVCKCQKELQSGQGKRKTES